MRLSQFCITRPVFSTVLSLVLVAAGMMGLHYLDTRYLPRFESNHLTVTSSYAGASAALMETSVTTPLEDAVSGVEGIDTITSTSSQNMTQIDISLVDGVNVNAVVDNIRAQIDSARGTLPTDASAPQVQIRNMGAQDLLDIGVTDPNMSLPAIRDYLQRNVVDGLRQLPGVALVNVVGADAYVMRITLDPKQMAARRVTLADIQTAINKSNVELPAGTIHGAQLDYPVTAATKLRTPQQFKQLVVKQQDARAVMLGDVADVAMGSDPTSQSVVRINAKPGVFISISATDTANPIRTAHAIKHYLASLAPQLPGGLQLTTVYDQSIFMEHSIDEVYFSIAFAVVCVLLVIMLFLGEWRSVLVPVVTIPICVFATFGLMYFFGFTINVITLLALVLSIGLVVDDAIVMLENIYRYLEQGMSPFQAAMKGSREIAFAVIAMTLTLAAVYAPVGFVHGKVGAIFKPFAFTLAGAVILSGFVALTLSPMMCAHLLKAKQTPSRYGLALERWFHTAAQRYERLLAWFLQKRFATSAAVLLIIITGFFVLRSFSFSFMPDEDMGLIIAQNNVPSGANISYVKQATEASAQVLKSQPGVDTVLSIAMTGSSNMNFSFATLKPFGQRELSSRQVADSYNNAVSQVPGLSAFAFPISFGGSMKSQLQFVLTSDKSYPELYQISQQVINQLKQYPGLQNLSSSLSFDSQQYAVTVNRDLAAQLKVNIQDIDTLLMAMLGGLKVSTIDVDGQYYDVYALGQSLYQQGWQHLDEFNVMSTTGQAVPLSNLVTVRSTLAQNSLGHYQRQRAATLSATLAPGYTLGDTVHYLQQTLPQLLPQGVHFAFQGAAKNITDTSGSIGVVFLLALVFIYLVLSAQFESFLDPFVILLAVPFSVIGALLALKLINGGINLYTIVGLVTLIGLVAKHGILITQFANELCQTGMAPREAVIQAAKTRFRPILMTTAAMMVGALPLTFAMGAGAVSRQQIGVVITSGLLFGTFFSLILVPATYAFMHKLRARWRRSRPARSSHASLPDANSARIEH